MKILSETNRPMVEMNCDFTEEERSLLLDHARKNMTVGELERLMIEWAFVKALENSIESDYWKKDAGEPSYKYMVVNQNGTIFGEFNSKKECKELIKEQEYYDTHNLVRGHNRLIIEENKKKREKVFR